jgi:hypothetical protein
LVDENGNPIEPAAQTDYDPAAEDAGYRRILDEATRREAPPARSSTPRADQSRPNQ